MLTRSILIITMSCFLLASCASNQVSKDKSRALRAARANTQLGIEYLRTGDYELSRKRLAKAIQQAPDYAGAHDAIAVLYERVNKMGMAEKHYKKSLRLDSKNSAARNNYAQFLCKTDRSNEAVTEFETSADNPFYRTPWVPLTNAGVCMVRVPDKDKAVEYFERALQLQPEYAPALLQMGLLNYTKGKYLSVRAYLQRFQQVAPHTAESLWLAIRTEYSLSDHQAWGNYAIKLKNAFPKSEQYVLLQEWENERRSGH